MRIIFNIFLIMIGLITMLYFIGYSITKDLSMYFINIIVGFFVAWFLSAIAHTAAFILKVFTINNKIRMAVKIYENAHNTQVQDDDLLKTLHEKISIYNLIKPMGKEEFMDFLDKDGYGNKNPNKEHILNLLRQIKDKEGFENHEMWIYEKLSELKNEENE